MSQPEVRRFDVPTRTKVGGIMVLLLVFIATVGISIAYTNRVNDEAQKRSAREAVQRERVERESEIAWCGILSVFLEAYKSAPPATPAGKAIQRGFEDLYRAYRCS